MLIILWYNIIRKEGYNNESKMNGGQTNMNLFIYHKLNEITAHLDEILKVLKELKEVRKNEHQ